MPPSCGICIDRCPTPDKCLEIERLRNLVFHYADQSGVSAEEVQRVHKIVADGDVIPS